MDADYKKKLSTAVVDILKYAALTLLGVFTGAQIAGCALVPVFDF